ncbi:MAG: TfoX/Sxy family protein [Patescibacteria group bacterium]
MSDRSFHGFVIEEVLREIPGITSRSMFGGWGIYKDGIFFALIADNQLYFKVDDSNKKDYQNLGSEPFVYESKHGKMTMSYWLLPEEVMSDKERLKDWVDKSVEASIKSKKKK